MITADHRAIPVITGRESRNVKRTMKRLRRILFNTLTAISLLLALATAGLWVAGLLLPKKLIWVVSFECDRPLAVMSHGSGISFWRNRQWEYGSFSPERYLIPGLRTSSFFGGHDEETWAFGTVHILEIHYGLLTGSLVLCGVPFVFHKRRGPHRPHLCPACGYDMRANPAKCSECGHEMKLAGDGGDVRG